VCCDELYDDNGSDDDDTCDEPLDVPRDAVAWADGVALRVDAAVTVDAVAAVLIQTAPG